MPNHIQRAVDLAVENVNQGGKPFACIVVDRQSGEVLIEATNRVAQTGDVTAHAETTAIRELAAQGRTDLTGCDVYVTASPCPMCTGALYYANPEQVIFGATREQEAEHYEDGNRWMTLLGFYDEFAKPVTDRTLPHTQRYTDDPTASFKAYAAKHDG